MDNTNTQTNPENQAKPEKKRKPREPKLPPQVERDMHFDSTVDYVRQELNKYEQRVENLLRDHERPPQMPLILSAINKIMEEIGPIAKNHEHPDEGFDFRRIDEVLTQLQPLLIRHRVFYVAHEVVKDVETERPVITQDGSRWIQIFTKVTVAWRLYCTLDGSFISCQSVGEGMSEQQFSTASAQTMAEKTMLCDVFAIPDGWPGANVFSVGDVIMLLGVILAIHAVSGSRLTGSGRTELQRSQGSPAAR